MKKLICLFVVILLSGCAGPQLSLQAQKIISVNDTSKCTFIQNGYTEVALAHTLTSYIQRNVDRAGGDSYKMINTSQENVGGTNIFEANFEIWKCKNEIQQPSIEPLQVQSVSDTSKCSFIKSEYMQAMPYNMIQGVQSNAVKAGGDSYKIISTNNTKALNMDMVQVNYEIYKCK